MATHTKIGKKNAMDVNVSNDISLDAGDIQIGAVELKDADSTTRTKIADGSTIATTDNALATADANLKQTLDSIKDTDGIKGIADDVNVTATDLDVRDLTSATDSVEAIQSVAADLNMTEVNSGSIQTAVELIDDAIATTDSAGVSKNMQIGLVAESTIPTEMDDGDSVPVWADLFGRQVIAGFSQAVNSLNVQESSPAELLTIESTLLDAVTATGASSAIDLSNYNKVKFQVVKSGTATVDIQESLDDSTYDTVQADVDGIVTISGEALKYVKANVSAYTDGSVTVKMIGGR